MILKTDFIQGRRQDFFQGGSEGYILDFPRGVGDQIFAHLYGQIKKIAIAREGQPTPLIPPPADAPVYISASAE